jgi:hypothetical protein
MAKAKAKVALAATTILSNSETLKAALYARIDAIASAEKITKHELAAFSRESLMYVVDTNDIGAINRLLDVLTPMNRLSAIAFFGHFLPWEKETDNNDVFQRFGSKYSQDKKFARKVALITEWLKDVDATIWTWAAANLDLYTKKNWAANISKAVEKALKGEDNDRGVSAPISMGDVMAAVMAGGISIEDMLEAMPVEEVAAQAA